tara:strand:+ start:147 stop:665 length:519 start_codon:yes stop_codon:yes gene_type:complete
LSIFLALILTACASASAGLNSFQSTDGRYGFLYPTGWTRVAVSDGPQVVFHDIINSDETLSLVISEVGNDIDLESLGTPDLVGKRLIREVIAPEGSGREVELVHTGQRQFDEHIFYDLEYIVHLEGRDRHELSSVVIDRGNLYTFATSTSEKRWSKVNSLFEKVISSFTFLI